MNFKTPLATLFFAVFTLLHAVSARADTFKVGMILSLSGPTAANGLAMRNAIELAKEDAPGSFTNIEFIYEDAAFDSKQALAAFMKLQQHNDIDLFYVWGIAFCQPIAPVAKKLGVAVVCQGIERESYMHDELLVRFMNSTDEYAAMLAGHIREKQWKNVGVLLTETPYVEAMFEALKRSVGDGVTFSIIDSYAAGPQDMSSSVSKIKRGSFDAIGVFLASGQLSTFYKMARQQRLEASTFGTNFFENLDDIKLAEGAMDGAVYVHNVVEPAFISRYEQAYGNKSQLAFGAMAYEFSSLVGDLFNAKAGSLNAQQIIATIASVPERDGKAMGRFRFVSAASGDRYFSFPVALKEVRGQGYIVLKTARP